MVSLKVLVAVSLASVSVLASPAPAASAPGSFLPASLSTAAPVPASLPPAAEPIGQKLPDTPEPVFWSDDRIHVLGTRNRVDEKDMQDAIRCLSKWCTKNSVEKNGKARCVIGSAVVYLCNYGNDNPCSGSELLDSRAEVHEKTGSVTGWLYIPGWKKTYVPLPPSSHSTLPLFLLRLLLANLTFPCCSYGFDRWCPDGL